MAFEFFDKAKEVMKKLENTQQENYSQKRRFHEYPSRFEVVEFFRHLEVGILMRELSKYVGVQVV